MGLNGLDYFNGISSLIYVAVTIFVGVIILLKYFKLGQRAFLFVGLTWIGMSEPWIPSGMSFLWNLVFQEGLPFEAYVIIGNVLVPISVFCWMVAFTDLIYKKQQKLILAVYAIIGIVFEIVFFILLAIKPDWIGVFEEAHNQLVRIDIKYQSFILLYLVFTLMTLLVSGTIFARNSLQSKVPEVNLKGKFLIIAWWGWVIGGLLDSAIPLNPITLPITRILLVVSSLLFYTGYILPPGIKDLVLKE